MFTEMDYKAETKAYFKDGFAAGEAEGIVKGKAEGREEGRAEGRAKGIQEGEAARSRDIAAAMLSKGLDAALVASCTGLSAEEVREMSMNELHANSAGNARN